MEKKENKKLEILRILETIHHERRLTFETRLREPKYKLLSEWYWESIYKPRMIVISFLAQKIKELNEGIGSFIEEWTPWRDVEVTCSICGELEFFYCPEGDAWDYKTLRKIYYWKIQHLKQHLK